MTVDPATLNEKGLKDGLAEFGRIANFLAVRLKDAEARLATAEQDVTEFRKLVGLVRSLSESYRDRLAVVQAEQAQ